MEIDVADVASPLFRLLPAGYTPSVHALVDPLDADPAERPRRKRISTQVEQRQEHGAEHIPSAAKVGMEGHEPFKWFLGKSFNGHQRANTSQDTNDTKYAGRILASYI